MKDTREFFADNITTWRDTFRTLCRKGHEMQKLNPEIVVPAKNLPDPDSSPIFERSELLSLEKGADRVFRDNNTENTLQVRVYKDGEAEIENKKYQQPVYHVQLDRHNPSKGVGPAVAHLFTDIIGIDIPSNIIQ